MIITLAEALRMLNIIEEFTEDTEENGNVSQEFDVHQAFCTIREDLMLRSASTVC